MPQKGETVCYQPFKSIVHCRQVALYSSKARGKGEEMAALQKHLIDCQTVTLLSWEIKEFQKIYEPVQARHSFFE